jgi:hypothetical protein
LVVRRREKHEEKIEMREGEFFHLSQIQRQFCVICNISYFPLCFPLMYGLACLGDSGS